MRIISGTYRGKKLFSPDSDKVRPTSDRAREAVFNILNSSLTSPWGDYALLDVFSGTGAFALEAVSRGVGEVCMIDADTCSLQKNAALFPREREKLKIVRADVAHLPSAPRRYGLMFMDAPYNRGLSEVALCGLNRGGWLDNGALCMVEVEKTEQIALPSCYKQINERIYGLAKVLFLKYETLTPEK